MTPDLNVTEVPFQTGLDKLTIIKPLTLPFKVDAAWKVVSAHKSPGLTAAHPALKRKTN